MRRTLVSLSLLGALSLVPFAYSQQASHIASLSVASNSEISLAISPTLVDSGTPVTLKADVQPTQGGPNATGTVGFYFGGLQIGTAPVSGTVAVLQLDTRAIPNGTFAVTARYNGDSYYQPSVSQPNYFSVVLFSNTNITLASSPSNVDPGTPVVLKADVQPIQGGPNATGYVAFFAGPYGNIYLGSAPISNTVATLSVPTRNIAKGAYPTYAIYLGNSIYKPSISNPSWIYVQ